MTFSEQTLMAYVDGELEGEARAAVERAITADPELAGRIARYRSLRQALQSAYDPVLDEPVPERLLAAVRTAPAGEPASESAARPNVVSLREGRARPPRRWSAREWTALAASLIVGAILGSVALRSFDTAPLATSGGRLVASGALASALSEQLASQQAPDARVAIGVTFVAKSGDYCRTFSLRERATLAGLACRNGRAWQVEVLAKGESQPAAGAYRQAASPIPPAVLQMMQAEIAGDPLDARAEAAARASGWKR